jgi:hypothetical protein
MTYLQIVNSVLRRLREDEVTAVADSTYSTLIGDLVNDAKKYVEDSWDWTALREAITVTTVASTKTYALTGSGQDFKLLNSYNDTSDGSLTYRTNKYFDDVYITTTTEGSPSDFTYRDTDASGDTQVEVYPTPDGVYSLVYQVINRPASLSSDTDVLVVPSQPVIYMALALATRERGEQGGTSAAEYMALADTFLADAIALDASKYEDQMIYQVV